MRPIFHLLACCLIATFFHSTVLSLQTGPLETFNGNEYQFFQERLSFQNAEQECQVWGGSLVSVLSLEEQAFALNMSQTLSTDASVWIGLSDRVVFGTWVWNDAEATAFLNWKSGAPSSILSEHCVVLETASGEWDDVECDQTRMFMCKRPAGQCAWGSRVVGAPKPTISTQLLRSSDIQLTDNSAITQTRAIGDDVSAGTIEIRIDLAQKAANNVLYGVSFSQGELPEDACPAADLIPTELWDIDRETCTTSLTLSVPFEEIIPFITPSMVSSAGSDIVTLSTPLYLYYYDANAEGCTISRYSTVISVRTILIADSQVEFLFEGGAIIQDTVFAALTLNSEGRLVIDAIITPTHERFRFENFVYQSHSKGVVFTVDDAPLNCDTPGASCRYRLNMISTTSVNDYSGDLVLSFHFYWNEQNVTHTTMTFRINYAIIEEPPVLENVINTETSLVDASFSQETDVFVPFERAYIRTQTVEPLGVDNVQFAFRQVFLCCTRNRAVLAPYNPSEGNLGCTVNNPAVMSVWEQLIVNGQVNSDLNVRIENLGPLINNQAVLSFDPFSLYGEDKLCYIHSRVGITLDVDLLPNKRDIQTIESDSTQAISFKSCSIYNDDPQACYEQDGCQYNDGTQTCYNYQDSGAASVRVASLIGALLMGCTLLVMH